jgi:hypothetical protein
MDIQIIQWTSTARVMAPVTRPSIPINTPSHHTCCQRYPTTTIQLKHFPLPILQHRQAPKEEGQLTRHPRQLHTGDSLSHGPRLHPRSQSTRDAKQQDMTDTQPIYSKSTLQHNTFSASHSRTDIPPFRSLTNSSQNLEKPRNPASSPPIQTASSINPPASNNFAIYTATTPTPTTYTTSIHSTWPN